MPPLQAEARLQSDIKATKTIAITVAAYFLCYVPMIGYALILGLLERSLLRSCLGFIAWYSMYISSAINPIIYYLRTNRLRSAFKQFLKDPFGSSDFKEKPNNSGNGEKRKVEDMLRKKRDERNDDEEQPEVHIDENQTRHKYSGQRRNARPCIHESVESKEYGEAQELSRGACAIQAQKPYDGKEENEEVLKGCGLANKSRKPFRTKVRPLEITELDNTGNLAEEKLENTCCPEKKPIKTQTSSRKRCNKITSAWSGDSTNPKGSVHQ